MELTTRVIVFLLFHPLVTTSILSGGDPTAEVETVDVTELPQVVYLQSGRCQVNETYRAAVMLRNRTDVGYTISDVETDCGCSTAVVGSKAFGPNETIGLDFEMSGSTQIAKLRRSVRVFFRETSSPLILHFDIRVRGPIELDQTNFELSGTQKTLEITGKKSDSELVITDVVSGRGSFLVDRDITQDRQFFRLQIVPLHRFGAISDIVRVRFRKDAKKPSTTSDLETYFVELPIEMRWSSSVRFLPSTATLQRAGDRWIGKARMIMAARAEPLQLDELRFAFGRFDEGSKRVGGEGKIQPLSAVLSVVQISVPDDATQAMPHFVEIEDRNGSLLGTLHLSLQGQQHAKN